MSANEKTDQSTLLEVAISLLWTTLYVGLLIALTPVSLVVITLNYIGVVGKACYNGYINQPLRYIIKPDYTIERLIA